MSFHDLTHTVLASTFDSFLVWFLKASLRSSNDSPAKAFLLLVCGCFSISIREIWQGAMCSVSFEVAVCRVLSRHIQPAFYFEEGHTSLLCQILLGDFLQFFFQSPQIPEVWSCNLQTHYSLFIGRTAPTLSSQMACGCLPLAEPVEIRLRFKF